MSVPNFTPNNIFKQELNFLAYVKFGVLFYFQFLRHLPPPPYFLLYKIGTAVVLAPQRFLPDFAQYWISFVAVFVFFIISQLTSKRP